MHRPPVGMLAAGGFGLALALALPAAADHENRSRPWWHQNVSRPRPAVADVHGHGHPGCAQPRANGHAYRGQARRAAYQCAPCRHRFHDYGTFTRHLNHHHRVPFWRIPFVLVEAAFGWVFYG